MNDGMLTHILNAFVHVIGGGFGRLTPAANHLLYTIMGIDIVFFGLFYAMEPNGSIIAKGMRKMLGYGFFVLLVTQWAHLTAILIEGFEWAGLTAGGGSTGMVSVQDPSGILDYGFQAAAPMQTMIASMATGMVGTMKHLPTIILYELCIIVTVLAFALMAIQCVLAYLEFMIVAVLSLILLPFGPWKHTKFLSEKSLGAVLSHGIKLMTLTFVIAIAGTVFKDLIPAGDVSVQTAMTVAVATMCVAVLCLQAPNLAAGLMSGSPSLGAGAMLGAAAGAAMGGAAALRGGQQLASGGARVAGAGAAAAANAAGAMSQGAMTGMAAKGAGALFAAKAAGAVSGGVGAALSGLGRKATAPGRNMGEFLKTNFQHGQLGQQARTMAKGSGTMAPTSSTSRSSTAAAGTARSAASASPAGGDSKATGSYVDMMTMTPGPAGGSSNSSPTSGGSSNAPRPASSTASAGGGSKATGTPADMMTMTPGPAGGSPSSSPTSGGSSNAPRPASSAASAGGGSKAAGSPADMMTKTPGPAAGSISSAANNPPAASSSNGSTSASQLAQRAFEQAKPGDGGSGSVQVNLPTHE